jgi:hypothetical protein
MDNMMRYQESLSVFFLAALGTIPAYAHHAASAAFITTETVEIEGYVNELVFKNPHVNLILTVTDDSGAETPWMVTASSTASMRRWGWTEETLQEGQYLRLHGNPSRDGGPMMMLEQRALREGEVVIVELDPTDGSVIGPVVGTNQVERRTADSLSPTLSDGRPNLTGTWLGRAPGSSTRTPPPLNEAGRVMQAAYDPATDPAFTECQAPGLVRTVTTIHATEIEQHDDHVVVGYEGGGDGRVIYLDGRGPETDEHTPLGHAVARYENGALVIETTQLLSRLSSLNGNTLSDQARTVETYRRADDPERGPLLEMNLVITDPMYLEGPWEMTWQKPYAAEEYDFTGVDCRVPFRAADARNPG